MEDADNKSVQVTAYLPKDVHEQLKKWMDDNYQRSVSSAVSLIVEHFLKKDGRPLGDTDLGPRVTALEQENIPPRLTQLEQQMRQLREALIAAGAISLASGVEEHLAENTSIEGGQFIYSVKEAREGLSKTEIMRRLDLTATTLKRLAETERTTEEKYLMKVTGWQLGSGERPKFYPPPPNGQGQG
ncbi:hypothetical protein [Nostoc parmelioides]|uniref:CopG-like ribbon-helix-helix domain-containing protein n=1 Tax=Nostoc parmelioides FACHB-3921 TaxID=2692909 RepID=A0ABR8BP66_9NOSO|nr:hypothetical protein [Nostoc parmelioides]MBD2255330.1 hypothetical protein [Nostoc parmelioides FACHB-3921]